MSAENIDFLHSYAQLYKGSNNSSWHGTTIQVVQPLPSLSIHPEVDLHEAHSVSLDPPRENQGLYTHHNPQIEPNSMSHTSLVSSDHTNTLGLPTNLSQSVNSHPTFHVSTNTNQLMDISNLQNENYICVERCARTVGETCYALSTDDNRTCTHSEVAKGSADITLHRTLKRKRTERSSSPFQSPQKLTRTGMNISYCNLVPSSLRNVKVLEIDRFCQLIPCRSLP